MNSVQVGQVAYQIEA